MADPASPGTSAGTPNGLSPSGATSPGTTAADEGREVHGAGDVAEGHPVPGQPPGATASPVPSPGNVPGATVPAVAVGEGPSPADGIVAGVKDEDSDASVASPGSYVALSPPGHPDGEVDTRAR